MIYFDNAATTYPKPECVYDAVNVGMRQYSFNAGRGSYIEAKKTFDMIEYTRSKIASVVDAVGSQVVFTSSATESLNNILYGLDLSQGDCAFVSPFEHNAVIRTLVNIGVSVIVIPFDKCTWQINEDELNDLYVIKKPKVTVLSHISNVTGFELPYEMIFKLAKRHQSITILDCAQSFGIYPINKENVDILVFAGHKSLYAVFGIAGYINISEISLSPYKVGGTGSDSLNTNMPDYLPSRYEAGSPNSVGIYVINKSLEYILSENFAEKSHELTKYLLEKLYAVPNAVIYLPDGYVSKSIVSFSIRGFSADDIGTILGEDYNICVRTGYHCAPYVHAFLGSEKSSGTVRVSLGIFNTKNEIDVLINALREIQS